MIVNFKFRVGPEIIWQQHHWYGNMHKFIYLKYERWIEKNEREIWQNDKKQKLGDIPCGWHPTWKPTAAVHLPWRVWLFDVWRGIVFSWALTARLRMAKTFFTNWHLPNLHFGEITTEYAYPLTVSLCDVWEAIAFSHEFVFYAN